MKERTQNLLIAAALGHLGLVAIGAAYVDFSEAGPASLPLQAYGSASGAGRTYGFFAPGVGPQLRARFEVIDAAGHSRELSLLDGSSREADLRVSNIITEFLRMEEAGQDDSDEQLSEQRRTLAASLAGTFFGRNPGAKEVAVHLDEYAPISMEQYRAGERTDWDEIYLARFRHDAPATAEAGQ